MMKLSIVIFKTYCLIEVLMCLFEITLIEVHVTSVEIVIGVVLIEFDSFIVIPLGLLHLSKVVIGKTTIFEIERKVLWVHIFLFDCCIFFLYSNTVRL